jgi:hypothetical protein
MKKAVSIIISYLMTVLLFYLIEYALSAKGAPLNHFVIWLLPAVIEILHRLWPQMREKILGNEREVPSREAVTAKRIFEKVSFSFLFIVLGFLIYKVIWL